MKDLRQISQHGPWSKISQMACKTLTAIRYTSISAGSNSMTLGTNAGTKFWVEERLIKTPQPNM